MQTWTKMATEVLRETSSMSTRTCDHALREAMVNATDAVLAENEHMSADLRIYHLVMQELYGSNICAAVFDQQC